VKAFLFDLDGTLLDSIDLIVASFHHTREVHFGDRLSDATWIANIGRPLRETFAEMARSQDERDAMIATYVEYNLEAHDAHVKAFPHATEVVRTLAERGHPLALVTGKRREGAERGVHFLGLEDELLPVSITADDVERGKPDPEPVRKALAELRVDAGDACFVGDSTHDIHSGRAAGVETIAVSWGPFERAALEAAGPDRFIDDLRELLV